MWIFFFFFFCEKWLLRVSASFGAFVASSQRNNSFPHKPSHQSGCNRCKSEQLAASGSAGICDSGRKAGTWLRMERPLPNFRASAVAQARLSRRERRANCRESHPKQRHLSESDFSLPASLLLPSKAARLVLPWPCRLGHEPFVRLVL